MPTKRQTCFVVMPFAKTTETHTEEYWTRHFTEFLKKLIEESSNLEARRPEALRGDILRQIITDLVVSPVVVADITDSNPNVCWELGVRQSFKHGTITIAEYGVTLPFDLGTKGTLFYHPKDYLKNEGFRTQFKQAIADCLAHSDSPDSPVLETLSGRGSLFQIMQHDESLRRVDAVLSECSSNKYVFDRVFTFAQGNQDHPEARSIETRRFRRSAVELLVTTRYLNQDQQFYGLAEECLDELIRLNDQLGFWEHALDSTEKWLLGYQARFKKIAEGFTEQMQAVREQLASRSY